MKLTIINATSTLKRNSSVEFLRILFMLLIVIGHVYAHGSNLDYQCIYDFSGQINTFWHTSMFSLCKIGVTGFMFITGYYGIKFDFKKLVTLYFTALFYYVILSRGGGIINMIQPYSLWWYLNSYCFIYILSPFIEFGFKAIDKKILRTIVLIIVFYNYIGKFLMGENSHDTELLLSIYIIARYIKCFSVDLGIHKYGKFICCGLFLLLTFLPIMEYNIGLPLKAYQMTMSNNSLLVLLFVIYLVKFADMIKTHSNVTNWIATSTLSVYLITDYPSVRNIINPYLYEGMFCGTSYFVILLIFLLCIFIDKLRIVCFSLGQRFVNPIIQKIRA